MGTRVLTTAAQLLEQILDLLPLTGGVLVWGRCQGNERPERDSFVRQSYVQKHKVVHQSTKGLLNNSGILISPATNFTLFKTHLSTECSATET